MKKNLKTILLLLSIIFASDAYCAQKMNVLFIAVDDLRPELNCYGESHIISPNIDRLASESTVFRRQYVQIAVCIPSRVALLTSTRSECTRQLFGSLNVRKMKDIMPMGKYFSSQGYKTITLGKIWHVVNEPNMDKFDEYIKFKPDGSYPNSKKGPKKRPPYEHIDQSDDEYADTRIANAAVKRLKELAEDKDENKKPFFFGVGFLRPHLPFVCPKKYYDMYKDVDMPLPKNPKFPKNAPECASNFKYGDLKNYTDVPKHPDPITEKQMRDLRRSYFACITFVDTQVGKILNELDRSGLAKNTIVVLWGDHGWHLGEQGMWTKHTNFETAARSPLIIKVPGLTKGDHTYSLAETVDIYPTLVELIDGEPLKLSQGQSLVPILKNKDAKIKDNVFHLYNRYIEDGKVIIGMAARNERYRYVEWREGWEIDDKLLATELYDYDTDPYETVNIVGNPENAEIVKKMANDIKVHREKYPIDKTLPTTVRLDLIKK